MYSSDMFVDQDLDDLSIKESELQAGELERHPSMKVLVKKEGDKSEEPSYFARWFETVPPNKQIREDEYFWHTGQSLDPDFWTSEEKLDNYLGMNEPMRPMWESDSKSAEFPLTLSLNFDDDDSESISSVNELDVTRGELERQSSASSWSLDTISVEEEIMDVPSFRKEASDWSQMPPLLPKLELNVAPQPLTREKSDWTKMPALLPPLKQDLEKPSFEKTTSDWSVMPNLLPPLMQSTISDPSEWVPMPDNMVPKAVPQVSWEAGLNEVQSPPMWSTSFPNTGSDGDPSIPRQYGLVNTREMEYLSSGDANIGLENNLPVVAIPQQNAYFAPVGQMYNPMVQPMQMQPQTNALVQYQPPLETTNSAVGSMVVARQPANPTIPPQFSFYFTGEYNIVLYHVPYGTFITPSKTATEVLVHVMFPVIYIHVTGKISHTGFAHSCTTVDASLVQDYFPTNTTFVGRQAYDVMQVN